MDWFKENFTVTDDKQRLDAGYIHEYLCNHSYWARDIPLEIVRKTIEGSVCFGLLENNAQIGFARVVTDKATFGYLADVFIDEKYRGRGLAKWLMGVIMNHPELVNFRCWMLRTRDAHSLYRKFGFAALEYPERVMEISVTGIYGDRQQTNTNFHSADSREG